MARSKSPATTRRRREAKPYHHGGLRSAMVAATLDIIEEKGLAGLSVREAAKRAGVSAGAPFRHFSSRRALLTAVAEEATLRLRSDVDEALSVPGLDTPRKRLRAIASAYMGWALANPLQFEMISDRRAIDYEVSPILRAANDDLRALMDIEIASLLAGGEAAPDARDVQRVRLEARALAYGLARMMIDGHFSDWSVDGEGPMASISCILGIFIARLGGPAMVD